MNLEGNLEGEEQGVCAVKVGVGVGVGVGVCAFEGTCTCKKNVVIQHSEVLVLVRSAGIHVPVLYQVQVPGYSLSRGKNSTFYVCGPRVIQNSEVTTFVIF